MAKSTRLSRARNAKRILEQLVALNQQLDQVNQDLQRVFATQDVSISAEQKSPTKLDIATEILKGKLGSKYIDKAFW